MKRILSKTVFAFGLVLLAPFWDNSDAFLGHMLAYMVRNRRAERQAQIKTARIDRYQPCQSVHFFTLLFATPKAICRFLS